MSWKSAANVRNLVVNVKFSISTRCSLTLSWCMKPPQRWWGGCGSRRSPGSAGRGWWRPLVSTHCPSADRGAAPSQAASWLLPEEKQQLLISGNQPFSFTKLLIDTSSTLSDRDTEFLCHSYSFTCLFWDYYANLIAWSFKNMPLARWPLG